MKRFFISLLSLFIVLISTMSLDAKVKRTKNRSNTTLPANLNELMRAPNIKTNAEGFYQINRDAPRTFSNLKINTRVVDGWKYRTKIYINGKLLQTITYEATQNEIKFFDANFDGYVDILFGAAAAREYSAIFLWEPNSKKFVQAIDGNQFNGLMVVNPGKKELYSGGSGSAFSTSYYISKWRGRKLTEIENLTIEDSSSNSDNSSRDLYSVIDGNGNIILETYDLSSVPNKWHKIMKNVNDCF